MEVVEEYQDTHKAIVEIDLYSFGVAYYMLAGIGMLLSWPASEHCYPLEIGMILGALFIPLSTLHNVLSINYVYLE